ncbi:MAG TPA: hypothetical protein VFC53_11890 [Dehalococcoidia bacterium]|nr:hypothetical protein [Dehalococcoidia bacterium]
MNRRTAHALLATALVALLAVACGGDANKDASATKAGSPTARSTAAPGETPAPEHLRFARGDTIAADRKAGIFFLDPETGAADAWVVPATEYPDAGIGPLPFTFTIGGASGDGSKVVYECLEARASGSPGPCGGGEAHVWYLLDTTSGERTRLSLFTGVFASISPDGKTLLGLAGDALATADADAPQSVDARISLPGATAPAAYADWSPDSERVVVQAAVPGAPVQQTYLVNVSAASARLLQAGQTGVSWSPDGSKLAITFGSADKDTGAGTLNVLGRDGKQIWSRALRTFSANPQWSADGDLLSVQVQEPSPPGTVAAYRLDIYDGATGKTRYRVAGAIACQGPVWDGDTHRVVVGQYFSGPAGSALVDLPGGEITQLGTYVTPSPDAGRFIEFDGHDFSVVTSAGDRQLIAHTTVTPSWDALHRLPQFIGGKIAFTSLHGGHGGCAEGASPETPPKLEVVYPPFADEPR